MILQRQREQFVKFIRLNRMATGRTKDTYGRFHGAVHYLSPRFGVMKSVQEFGKNVLASYTKNSEYVSYIFNCTLEDAGLKKVHPATVGRWMREEFGHGTDEHTTLAPHHTDACADCVSLDADKASLEVSLLRHEQQLGDKSIDRCQAISDTKKALVEVRNAKEDHRAEANAAQQAYKAAIGGAAREYGRVIDLFNNALELCLALDDSTTSTFVQAAAELVFSISSDYQMDKHGPTWGKSPQPGPTYFFSKRTQYFHVLCVESCGMPTGESRFRHNFFYTRDEEVVGSKTSDDKVSTLFDFLHGSLSPKCS